MYSLFITHSLVKCTTFRFTFLKNAIMITKLLKEAIMTLYKQAYIGNHDRNKDNSDCAASQVGTRPS